MYYTSMTINDRYEKQDDVSKIQKNILNANESELAKKSNHIYVSESKEGKPYAQWIVAVIVCVSAALAFMGKTMAATVIIAVTAIVLGIIRLIFTQKSPWKVRSVAFDSFISISLGIGLFITYFSIFFLM
ncbi:hypothetical protein CGSMWGv55152_01459 [Gardnerella vaginalis 55152]|uniref:Rod shape-determining protein RodA n=1 Tax=Gardnerella vaginalis 55152 TaxID=698955 RepID=I4LVV3_GARVA|nr:hypothetical protein [Gardnerella vaginalis]EIK81093.1 hypothetical protein CGSMWGv55152_01459 [Gardnerella vaginalis 55152]